MSLSIHLLGRPRVDRDGQETYQFRSRKSWALLAYLVLTDRPPTRSQLASLLFTDADDPLRALRWSLNELRRALGPSVSVDGDPVTLSLGPDVVVDVQVLARGAWGDAVELPGLGAELLDGVALRGAAAFEGWLLSERRRLSASTEAILHEAALGWMSRGFYDKARGYAVRAATMNPLDENHQALLIRLYRLAGDLEGARAAYKSCVDTFLTELGVAPGPSVEAALRTDVVVETDPASISAVVEVGSAAVAAGAVQAGLYSLRTAVALADRSSDSSLKVSARLVLAETLIHTVGGYDEEGLAYLHEADRIATASGDSSSAARARAELGYVDYLRGRYDRAVVRLDEARSLSPALAVMASTYLGTVETDRSDYPRAIGLLSSAVDLARASGEVRREAYALASLGRIHLLRGADDLSAPLLTSSIELAQRHQWLAFVPWPQSLLGEVHLLRSDVTAASECLRQAFARACQIGDPCWEGISSRGLGLLAAVTDGPDRAFELLADARARANRLADPYLWLDVYILDAMCSLGCEHGHPSTRTWADEMFELASRTGMRELVVRSLAHRASLGNPSDAEAAALLAADIDNPRLAADLRV